MFIVPTMLILACSFYLVVTAIALAVWDTVLLI
jgi:hypothetical protein